MSAVTPALVKDLREKTGAGMMDCKKALDENNADIEAAIDWLRSKGLAKAAKKAGRSAAEGLVAIASEKVGAGMIAALAELNAETDFVARNDTFQAAAKLAAQSVLASKGDVAAALAAPAKGSDGTLQDLITGLVATIGENMTLRRGAYLAVSEGAVATYVHNAVADGLGRIGVLVAIEGTAPEGVANDIGRKVAMHIAATSPLALNVEDLDQEVVARERAVFSEQARASGKPEAVIEKMIDGRIRKFYEEVVLSKQAFVLDPDQTVEAAVAAAGKAAGGQLKLVGFARLTLGEGVEKEVTDFAAEVAAAAGLAG